MLEWKKDGWKALISLAPVILFLIVFTFYPIVNSVLVAFFPNYTFAVNNASGISWGNMGLGAFKTVLTDRDFGYALINTAIMVIISVPLTIVISLLIAAMLNSIKKLQGFYQTIFFLPYVTNTIALGIVFSIIFSSNDTGLINTMLSWVGIKPIEWFKTTTGGTEPFISWNYWKGIIVISVYSVWNGLAFKILVFLSSMQSIDKQYYMAAKIDNTPKRRVFTKITIPLLSPQILYITITSLIGSFKAYSSIIAIYGEKKMGPYGSDEMYQTAVGYIYSYFNRYTEPGKIPIASVAAIILFVIILLMTMVQFKISKKRVHY